MDGLLIDSEGSWNETRKQIFLEAGEPWGSEDHKAVMGVNTREWVHYMSKRLDGKVAPDELETMVIHRMAARYRKSFPFFPGAVEAVQIASSNYPTGLASGSPRQLIDMVTNEPYFQGCFQVTVSADEVAAGKPAPDVYLETARRMGVNPSDCVCLEDSSNGIRSGKAAGMKVIAVPDARYAPPPAEVLSLADVVLSSLTEFSLETVKLLI